MNKNNKNYSERIEKLKELINNVDYIIIGAGAGLSASAGLEYGGKRFRENFSEFIEKYGFQNMYSPMFYPYESSEEKWAYFAKHVYTNNIGMNGTDLYKKLFELVKDKNYFVITTNVDDQFLKSGFARTKLFRTQGTYSKIQCSKACHDKLYNNSQLIREMIDKTDKDLKIPHELIPKCPICGEEMELNIRKDNFFIEDKKWHEQNKNYINFKQKALNGNLLLLEFGIGFNTPTIIRFPFDDLMINNENINLVRFNRSHLEMIIPENGNYYLVKEDELNEYLPPDILRRYIPFNENIEITMEKLLN